MADVLVATVASLHLVCSRYGTFLRSATLRRAKAILSSVSLFAAVVQLLLNGSGALRSHVRCGHVTPTSSGITDNALEPAAHMSNCAPLRTVERDDDAFYLRPAVSAVGSFLVWQSVLKIATGISILLTSSLRDTCPP